uniref:DUF148 domain-containing protein n=1 Tax=Parastrongyloides trichosuri TaxID=131310 RepID=A0A0N4ZMT5_PARTI
MKYNYIPYSFLFIFAIFINQGYGLALEPIIHETHYRSAKSFSYEHSTKGMLENCIAKTKVAGTLDLDYNELISKTLDEGRLDMFVILLQDKAQTFCTDMEQKMLLEFLKFSQPQIEYIKKYFSESSVTGSKNKVLNVLKNVLNDEDYKEFEREFYKVKKVYTTANLDNYYKSFYGKNHKLIDNLIYGNIDKIKVIKLMKELENTLIQDPRHEELRQFVFNLYSIKHGELKNIEIPKTDVFNPVQEEIIPIQAIQNNDKNKNIDVVRVSNSFTIE